MGRYGWPQVAARELRRQDSLTGCARVHSPRCPPLGKEGRGHAGDSGMGVSVKVASFADDFNRGDGAPGNGWVRTGTGPVITSQQLTQPGTGNIYRTPFAYSVFIHAQLDCLLDATHNSPYIWLRFAHTPANGYRLHLNRTGAELWHWAITRYDGLSANLIAQGYNVPISSGWHTLHFTANAANLSAKVDNTPLGGGSDNTYTANEEVRIGGPTSMLADNYGADDIAIVPTFDVDPDTYDPRAPDPPVEFTGTDTNWTPGTPGAPTFTVDKGSLSNQTVHSPTYATADYTTPVVEDTATFTDPSTGLQAQLPMSTNFAVTSGGSGSADEYFDAAASGGLSLVDWLGILEMLKSLLPGETPDLSVINKIWAGDEEVGGVNPILQNIQNNWATIDTWRLNGPWPTPTLRQMLESLAGEGGALTILQHIVGEANWSFQSAINTLKGPGNYDHTELADLIDTLTVNRTYTLLSVMQWISAVRGANNVDLTDVYSLLSTIAPTDLSPITNYLDWLTTNKTLNLSSLNALLQAITGNVNGLHDDLADDYNNLVALINEKHNIVMNKLNAIHADLATYYGNLYGQAEWNYGNILTQFGAVRGTLTDMFNHLTTVQNDVAYIKAHLGQPVIAAPMWPGLSGVTIGGPIALAVGVTVEGPLHGVLIEVTGAGTHGPPFYFDGDKSHQKIGAVTFQSDRGDDEFPQLLGFEHAVYTPKAMQVAARAKLRCSADVVGTVRKWTLTT